VSTLIARGDGAAIVQQLAKLRGAGVRKVVVLSAVDAASVDLPHRLLATLGGTQPT